MHWQQTFGKLIIILFLLFAFILGTHSVAWADCTNLWITAGSCGSAPGSEQFHPGDVLYFSGVDFTPGTHTWTIYGRPGSCDAYLTIARSEITIDSTGAFCFEAYTIATDDCGEYVVEVGECNKIYTVDTSNRLDIIDMSLDSSWREAITWSIDKTANPEQIDMFIGDQAEVGYTVSVDKTTVQSPAVISGAVTLQSTGSAPEGFSLAITLKKEGSQIDQTLFTALSSTGIYSFSFTLASPVEGAYVVEAIVAITNGTGDSQLESIGLVKTLDGYPTVHVTDGGQNWIYSDDGAARYAVRVSCDADEGVKTNTATIVETGQTASADITINCYAPEVNKSADPQFTRTYLWSIIKSGDKTEDWITFTDPLNPPVPAPATVVNYTVAVNTIGYVDSAWQATGTIAVHNPAPIPAVIQSVTDIISGAGAITVNFGIAFPYTLAAGGTLNGAYAVALPDGAGRTNTATAVLVNHYYAASEAPAEIGTSSFSGLAAIAFGEPTLLIDGCAALSDNLAGPLGTVCIADVPKSFHYSHTFGPWSTEQCGEDFTRTNIATLRTDDTGTTLTSQWQAVIHVSCEEQQRQPLGVKASCIDAFVYQPAIRVHFIVTNPNAKAVEILHGLSNALDLTAYQGMQPTLFAPGETEWEIEIGRYEVLQWLLDGSIATASLKTNICTYAKVDDVYIAGVGVFYDTNQNGRYDAGERLLAPDTEGKIGEVYLLDKEGKTVDSRPIRTETFFRAGRDVNFSMRQIWGEYYLVPQLSVPLPAGYRIYPNYRLIHTEEFPEPFYSLSNDFGLVPSGFVPEAAQNLDLPRVEALDWYFANPVKPGVAKAASEQIGFAAMPEAFALQQNYPNPFNPQTTISYNLSEAAQVLLTVYNVAGAVVARLADGQQEAGSYSTIWDAAQNPSGIYFYELRAGSKREVKRMLLMK